MKTFFLSFMCLTLLVGWSVTAESQMRVAHELPVVHNVNLSLLYLKQRIELDTKGRLRLDVIAEGSAGAALSLLEQVQSGLLPMAVIHTRTLKNIVPAFSLLDLPFVFPDRKSVYSFIDGPFRKRLDNSLGENKLFALAWFDIGPRKWLSTTKPFRKPLDFRESRMNIQDDFVSFEIVKALGATATTLPIKSSKIPETLKQGNLDVADILLEPTLFEEIDNFQANLTNSNHLWEIAILVASRPFWEDLTILDQETLLKAAHDMEIVNRGYATRDDAEMQIMGNTLGIDLFSLDEADRRTFLNVFSPVHQAVKQAVGQDLFNQFMSIVRDNRLSY